MTTWWKRIQSKWDGWSGDREMEQSIRRHLSQNGYFGTTATLSGVRLVAVQRPGWQQVFRFEVRARVDFRTPDDEPDPEPVYHDLYGLVHEDFRENRSQVRVFESQEQRGELFRDWSDGLICLRGAKGLLS
ncbi:hypothetical protein [Rhodopirellula bahusiensis]|uniref:Uncharacterized protein n=1 Tax=Rhodopirellula bahusiensis TaxID=2014065 RepID=A0A2G1VYL9_9BACT|nr:hypothetical protein [Rhodopirellula bahusiensis]PHQ31874.1 hypothetical protein CEE69_28805 [Rhodopirellula bahusiensis]